MSWNGKTNNDLSLILNKVLGLDPILCNRIVAVVSSYIVQALIDKGEAFVKGLGWLYLTKTKTRANLYRFNPTSAVRREITANNCEYLRVLEESYKDLGIDNPFIIKPAEDSDYRADAALLKKFKRRDIIRESLFVYLQRDFPYDYPWRHPATKKIYNCNRFKAAIRIAREHYEEGYECFYAIWISLRRKDEYLAKLSLSEKEFVQRAEKTLDLILQIVVNEDLEPSRMNRLFNLKHYIYKNDHGKESRTTSS